MIYPRRFQRPQSVCAKARLSPNWLLCLARTIYQTIDDSRHHGRPRMFQRMRVGNFNPLSPKKAHSSDTEWLVL